MKGNAMKFFKKERIEYYKSTSKKRLIQKVGKGVTEEVTLRWLFKDEDFARGQSLRASFPIHFSTSQIWLLPPHLTSDPSTVTS